MAMGRFSYVKYDQAAADLQAGFKKKFEELEGMIQSHLLKPEAHRSVCHMLDHLEICYVWAGKAIRDLQIARNPDTAPEQPERNNS